MQEGIIYREPGCGDAGKAGLVFEAGVGFDAALDVLVGEKALGALASDFVDSVDEKDAAFARFRFGRVAGGNAGLDG